MFSFERSSASSIVTPLRAKRPCTLSSRSAPTSLSSGGSGSTASSFSPAERLVFIDETWASTNMARRHRRCLRGQRLRVGVPHGHWKTTTFVAELHRHSIAAPFVLDGPINRIAFETYVDKVLVPELRPGDIVAMDNLSSHKGPRVREMIEAADARLLFLPPLQFRLQPDQERLLKAQGPSAKGRRAHRRRPVDRNRPVRARRTQQLLQSRRIRGTVIGFRSSHRRTKIQRRVASARSFRSYACQRSLFGRRPRQRVMLVYKESFTLVNISHL